jgi:hypothetical protein
MEKYIVSITDSVTGFASDYLILVMFGLFVVSVGLKFLIHYVASSYARFAKEFEKRVHRHLDGDYEETNDKGFQELVKLLLERTYHEAYILRDQKARRRMDKSASLADRVLLVEDGTRKMIFDTMKQTRYTKKGQQPELDSIVKFVYSSNSFMNNLMGFFPIYVMNNFLNILPGIFIIGGIFGTFLGITKGIPALKTIDPANLEASKIIMGSFLDKMSFSMNTSLFGIAFSVFFTIFNALFSQSKIKMDSMERFYHGLEILWKDSKDHADTGKKIDMENILQFDVDAEAEEVDEEYDDEEYDDEDDNEEVSANSDSDIGENTQTYIKLTGKEPPKFDVLKPQTLTKNMLNEETVDEEDIDDDDDEEFKKSS